jgi:hypothetical protein
MSRQKKVRPPLQDAGSAGGASTMGDIYTLTHDSLTGEDSVVDIKVRPRAKTKNGASYSLLGHLKLAPRIEIEDMPGSAFPVLTKQVVTIGEKTIMSDGNGEYWLLKGNLNPQSGVKLEDFCRQNYRTLFPIKVTVYVDLGGLIGSVAGMGGLPGLSIPQAAMQVPVTGSTKLCLRVNQWKVSFAKFMWQKQEDKDVAKIEGVDAAALERVCRYGGTVEVCLDGGIKLPPEPEGLKHAPQTLGVELDGAEPQEPEPKLGTPLTDAAVQAGGKREEKDENTL